MKSFAVFSVLLVAVAGNPVLLRTSPFIPIRSFSHDIGRDGVYSVRAEGADGTIASESGALSRPAGSLEAGATKAGSFSYTSPEGKLITLAYTADENGFRPTGDHLPVPPPMPEEIRAMLPTLPKLVEVQEHFVRAAPQHVFVRESAPIFIRESAPVFLPQQVLFQEPAPEKTLVRTNEFFIDSDNSKTIVKIGQ